MAGEQDYGKKPVYSAYCFTKDGEVDLTQPLRYVRIFSSLAMPYQAFILSFKIDIRDYVLEQIFGKHAIKLILHRTDDDMEESSEMTEYELLPVSYDVPIHHSPVSKEGLDIEVSGPGDFSVLCVNKDQFIYANTTVNKIFENIDPQTPIDAIEKIVDTYLPNLVKEIDRGNMNDELMKQIIIPPMTFIDSIRYLDYEFGIFKGPCFYFIDNDLNFSLWDLGYVLENYDPQYKVYQMVFTYGDEEPWNKPPLEDDVFYVTAPVQTKFLGNEDMATSCYEININTYPMSPDDAEGERVLFKWKKFQLKEQFEKYGIKGGVPEFHYYDPLKDRKEYRSKHEMTTALKNEEKYVYTGKIAGKSSRNLQISFRITKNIWLYLLTQIGMPIEYITQTQEYLDLRGKYIVTGTDIIFSRVGQDIYEVWADIKAIRGSTTQS